eukprot:scaffold266455_cov14-Tisochrysis_lutea.AAC.1
MPHLKAGLPALRTWKGACSCASQMYNSNMFSGKRTCLADNKMEFSAQHHNHHTRVAFQGLHAVLSPLKWPLCMAARKRRDH